jgi:hypothetical protein
VIRILHEIPCIVGKGNIGLDENKIITTLDSEIVVQISDTLVNRKIKLNDVFKIGLLNYSVTNINDIIIPGLLLLKMEYSAVEQTTHTFIVDILNGATISIQKNNPFQLNVQVLDNNVILSPTPTITYSSSDTSIATISSSGLVTSIVEGNCIITVTSCGVSDTISVTVTASIENDYSVVITGSESIKINKTATYNATIYNNGIIVTGINVVWSLIGSYASITSQDGDSCVITAGAISGNSVTLRATKSGEITIYKDFEINIVGLW